MQEIKSIPHLIRALDQLAELVENRLLHFFDTSVEIIDLDLPQENGAVTPLSDFVRKMELSRDEYLLLLLALAPHIRSDFFDQIIRDSIPKAGDFPQIGGVRGKQFRGFLPTAETALFILAGNNMVRRFEVQELFSPDHFFTKKRILWLEDPPLGEPRMSGKIILSQEYVDLFTKGKVNQPAFSLTFPAQLLETEMEWEDLVLNEQILQQIQELETWIKYGDELLQGWGMRKYLKPGYRALFYGPPGTGKTLTASLLGKYTGKEVYRVDLSMVVSKYIGETEKNLANLFAKAENKDWILFFDEADALFGKRTDVKDAHDRYANQEVSYLLQRVEGYNGLVILASNFKSNIDDAFMRRFQSIIYFPMPKASERFRIWRQSFPEKASLSTDIDLGTLSRKYELTGAGIINVVQYCCLESLRRGDSTLNMEDLIAGIKKEFMKEGRLFQ
jgi:hypothetical protein